MTNLRTFLQTVLATTAGLRALNGMARKRWVLIHENSLCGYTPELAGRVPEDRSTRRIAELAGSLGCYISFAVPEKRDGRHHISQVFVGPNHYFHHYPKTWPSRSPH